MFTDTAYVTGAQRGEQAIKFVKPLPNDSETVAAPAGGVRVRAACAHVARPAADCRPDSALRAGAQKGPDDERPGLGLGLVLCGVPVRAGDPPSVRQDVRRAYCACGSPSGSIGMLTCRILDTMTMHKGSTWMATM